MLGPHAQAVERCPGPVDLAVVTQPVQQPMVQLLHTPACCQARSRRQQGTRLPQPSARAGNSRQGVLERST
jgi:hypothetical protein